MVDYRTDAKIQQLLREELRDRTVVAIAHRLVTVLRYDKIAVMDQGCCVEFGEPYALWREGLLGICVVGRE